MTTISAKVIADSVSATSQIRLTTLQLRYPRWIHAELMTHRVFSRNASSSRAVPVKRLIEDVLRDPAVPLFWGKNQRGMQAGEDHVEPVSASTPSGGRKDYTREEAWLYACTRAVEIAEAFDEAGYHKQLVNRLLEPFSHINVVVTATEWANFFALRRHEAAEPHIHLLADEIFKALGKSQPSTLATGEWHLPYVDASELSTHRNSPADLLTLIKLSTARCARVSYLTHEGAKPSIAGDLALYDCLVGSEPLHASPTEHQATPDWLSGSGGNHLHRVWQNQKLHGNFVGWCQHRKMIELNYP